MSNGFDFDAKAGKGTGHYLTESGKLVEFLPAEPANSPPYELIHTDEADDKSPDGFRHYLIGGDPKVVDQVVAWYESRGKTVPANYKQEAADHAAAVEAAKGAKGAPPAS